MWLNRSSLCALSAETINCINCSSFAAHNFPFIPIQCHHTHTIDTALSLECHPMFPTRCNQGNEFHLIRIRHQSGWHSPMLARGDAGSTPHMHSISLAARRSRLKFKLKKQNHSSQPNATHQRRNVAEKQNEIRNKSSRSGRHLQKSQAPNCTDANLCFFFAFHLHCICPDECIPMQ